MAGDEPRPTKSTFVDPSTVEIERGHAPIDRPIGCTLLAPDGRRSKKKGAQLLGRQ